MREKKIIPAYPTVHQAEQFSESQRCEIRSLQAEKGIDTTCHLAESNTALPHEGEAEPISTLECGTNTWVSHCRAAQPPFHLVCRSSPVLNNFLAVF